MVDVPMNICIICKTEDNNARYLYEEFRKKNFSKVFLTDLDKLSVRISNKKSAVQYKTDLNWDVYIMRTIAEDFRFSCLISSILEKEAHVLPSSQTL